MAEAQLYSANSFLTLTFREDPISLDVRHLQLFFKRVRKRGLSVRHYSCGEYGERLGRPHYHVCLFGEDFGFDRWAFYEKDGFTVFRSPTLESLWTAGNSEIGSLTFESAAYVARYVTKKFREESSLLLEDGLLPHYSRVDPDSGELHFVKPEFAVMSRGGRIPNGIGRGYALKFRDEIVRDDWILAGGREVKPPRYFDSVLRDEDPRAYQAIKDERLKAARRNAWNCTDERLAVRQEVCEAKLSLKRRSYEA